MNTNLNLRSRLIGVVALAIMVVGLLPGAAFAGRSTNETSDWNHYNGGNFSYEHYLATAPHSPRTLHDGLSSEKALDVEGMQYFLWANGYFNSNYIYNYSSDGDNMYGSNCGVNNTAQVDGYFGACTRKAVKAFQRGKGLSQDGKIGWQTYNAIQRTATTAVCRDPGAYYGAGHFPPVGTVCELNDTFVANSYKPGSAFFKVSTPSNTNRVWSFDNIHGSGMCHFGYFYGGTPSGC